MPLEDLRHRIDQIDTALLALLNDRAALVHEVGVVKKAEGLQIYAPEREEKLLTTLVGKNDKLAGRLPEKSIRAIYREIMSAALALEDDLKIACLGPLGTWSHEAALSKFGASVSYTAHESLEAVFDSVARRTADYGVVPIENSTEGVAVHTLDLFAESPLHICAQIYLRVENSFMVRGPRSEIRAVYSHAGVLAQCRLWLATHFPGATLHEAASTTRAAEIAAVTPGAAALGPALLASLHGLQVIEANVQDNPTNTTRFLVIGERSCPPTGNDRTSLMFCLGNEPGALRHALAPFQDSRLNMSMIESRPSRRQDWEYALFVDVAGHATDGVLSTALDELKKHCRMVKVLGSYPAVVNQT